MFLAKGAANSCRPLGGLPRVGLSETPSLANRQVGVSLGHLDRAVTQQLPNFQQRRPLCHTPTGEGVSQVVNPKIRDSRAPAGRGKRSLD